MSDVPILVCACGKRLRAPGATPGRVGRCPDCGGVLRVPEPIASSAGEASSHVLEPAGSGPTTGVRRRARKRRKAAGATESTAIWNGLIRVPDQRETRVRDSLLYPLWGASGIALLVFLPPLLWFPSLFFITAVVALSGTDTPFRIAMLLILIPSALSLGGVLGYALLFLGRVAASSAMGETHHPHRPDWDYSSILFGLGRWLWAGLLGAVLGGIPAVAYWISCGDIDLFDTMILAELLAVGAVYALMALLASILHEDLTAANPVTVIRAIVKVGWGYAQSCLLAGFAVLLALAVLRASLEVSNPWLSAFLLWAFWVVVLYEAMVVLRVLGLLYHKHARVLGWFRDRTGWGV